MKVFLIDAYDSFVFIISQYLEQLGLETHVERHDVPDLIQRIEAFSPDFCVLGPGPGHPADVGYIEVIRHFQGRLPLLGVCLGHRRHRPGLRCPGLPGPTRDARQGEHDRERWQGRL